MEFKFAEMTLTNVAEGGLEQRFQECLAEIATIFSQFDTWQTDAVGRVKAKVKMELELSRDRDGYLSVAVTADVSPPKRVIIDRGGVHYREGRFLVSEEHKQNPLPLFPRVAGDTNRKEGE